MNQLREKLIAALESTQTVNRRLVVFVFLFVVVVVAILISLNSAKPYQSDAGSSAGSQAAIDNLTSESDSGLSLQQPTFFVHVVGEVVNPGIYVIDSNARLFDAIFAAGGFTKLADQSSVNLAREVSDGEQVIVMPVGAASSLVTGAEIGSATGAGRIETLISINRASQIELESLPGVGPTLAGRMVDWRTANGGFKKKEDLLRVTGIGQKLFASMKDRLTL